MLGTRSSRRLFFLAALLWTGFFPTQLLAQAPGTVVAWGYNGAGEATVPAGLANVIAIAAGDAHTVALKADGTVVAWGQNFRGQSDVPDGLSGVVAIAAGGSQTLALKSDGTVTSWGNALATPPDNLGGVVAIDAGGSHSLAVLADGSVVAWGSNFYGQATVPDAATTGVAAVAAGVYHSVALRTDGTIVMWGGSTSLLGTVPDGLTNVVAIAAGYEFTLALKSDGTVVAWGDYFQGKTTVPADLTGVVAIAAGNDFSLALKADGTVVGWGVNGHGQTEVAGLAGVSAIAGGGLHAAALVPQLSWSGVLQPVNADGSSVFKAGSTVPVKFRLTDGSAAITDLVATLNVAKIDAGVAGPVNEATSNGSGDGGNTFRYINGSYTFNWSTKGLTPGTYQLWIYLGDGVVRTLNVGLR